MTRIVTRPNPANAKITETPDQKAIAVGKAYSDLMRIPGQLRALEKVVTEALESGKDLGKLRSTASVAYNQIVQLIKVSEAAVDRRSTNKMMTAKVTAKGDAQWLEQFRTLLRQTQNVLDNSIDGLPPR